MIASSLCIHKVTVVLWGKWSDLGNSDIYEGLAVCPLQEILGHGKSLSASTTLFFKSSLYSVTKQLLRFKIMILSQTRWQSRVY